MAAEQAMMVGAATSSRGRLMSASLPRNEKATAIGDQRGLQRIHMPVASLYESLIRAQTSRFEVSSLLKASERASI
jgi:hypothetical protein